MLSEVFALFSDWDPVSWVLTYWVHSTLLLGGVSAAFLLLRRTERDHGRIWKCAALGGILTAVLAWSWGRGLEVDLLAKNPSVTESTPPNAFKLQSEQRSNSLEKNRETSSEIFRHSEKNTKKRTVDFSLSTPVVKETEQLENSISSSKDDSESGQAFHSWLGNPDSRLWSGLRWLLIVVLVSGCIRFLMLAFDYFRDLKSLEYETQGRAFDCLKDLCQRAQIRRNVRLSLSDRLAVPIALGWLQPTIVIPTKLEERLDDASLEALLAHELAHVARHDIFWSWIGRAMCLLFAFQPLNFLAFKRWGQASEFQCDRWAVQLGISPFDLARCLTEVAEWRKTGILIDPSARMSLSKSQLSSRVKNLVEPKRDRSQRGEALLLGLFLLGTLSLGWSGLKVNWENSDSTSSKEEPLKIELLDLHDEENHEVKELDQLESQTRIKSKSRDWEAELRLQLEGLNKESGLLEQEIQDLSQLAQSNESIEAEILEWIQRLKSKGEQIQKEKERLLNSSNLELGPWENQLTN